MPARSILMRGTQFVVGGAVLVAALTCLCPGSSTALSVPDPQGPVAAPPAAVAQGNLDQWQDTVFAHELVTEARRQSKSLNDAVRAMRAKLRSLQPNTFNYSLTLQSLLLLVAERDAWDQQWRRIGRRGVDPDFIQNQLISLQDQFVSANTQLQELQAKETSSGSISNYTPPNF